MNDDLSIEQLEHKVWPQEDDYATTLIQRCHEYRRIPVRQLTIEQIRLLLGQQIGVPFLLPRAVAILQNDILAEGDFYPGDLLSVVLNLPDETWAENREAQKALTQALLEKHAVLENRNLPRDLRRRIQSYMSS